MKKSPLFFVSLLSLLPLTAHAQSGLTIQQNTTTRKILLLVVKSADHITADTGDTLTVTLSKNGGAFTAPAGAVAEITNGWYALSPTAADTNTLGPLVIHVASTNGDPADLVENIAAVNQDDSAVFGLTGIGTLAGQTTISGKTNLIATNAADSPAAVTAQGALLILSKRTLNRQTYNPATKVLQLLNDDGTNYGPSLTLTIDANNNITAR